MKNDRDWIADATDFDWIESIAPAVPPAALAIELAAQPLDVPRFTATFLPLGDGLLVASWRGDSG